MDEISFVDIAPLSEIVVWRGKSVEVRGIGIDTVAALFYRFPQLRALLPTATEPAEAIDVESIVALIGKEGVAVLVAAATGKAGNAAEEKGLAAGLVLGEQVAFVAAIIRVSSPGGLLPLVDAVTGMLVGAAAPALLAAAAGGKAPDTSSSLPSTS